MASTTKTRWTVQFDLIGEHATTALALALKPRFVAGDTLLLSGPIGAGKSHFARAVIRAFLDDFDAGEDIPSPTFTLVQTYHAGDLEIWHSDLYRLSMVDEVYELGLIDAFSTALCLVEWPDRLQAELPRSALTLDFGLTDAPDNRCLTVSAELPKWDWVRATIAGLRPETAVKDG